MKFNEYMPEGGWMNYRKRQERTERVMGWVVAIGLLLAFVLMGTLEG